MNKVIIFGLAVVMMASLSACGSKTTTVDTEDGKVTVNTSGSTSWCQTGSNWNYQGTDGTGGEWKISELVSGGKYDGLCHVVYSGQGVSSDYYFNESGESGFVEMNLPNGQKFSQSWNK